MTYTDQLPDVDPSLTGEWVDSLDAVVDAHGPAKTRLMLARLLNRAAEREVGFPGTTTTPGRNAAHQLKKLPREQLRALRDRLGLGDQVSDEALDADLPPYCGLPAGSAEEQYLRERRQGLGGPVPWVPGRLSTLGTDGYGRSDSRAALRRHFETDAAHLVVTVLAALADVDDAKPEQVADAIARYDLDPEAVEPCLA